MDRARITAGEIATVVSRFDLGVVEEVRRYRGGSRHAPKVLLISRHSEHSTKRVAFILKRRPPGQDPARVALGHQIVLHLTQNGFPTPRLVGTRGDNNTMLQEHGYVYEVFRFVPGLPFDRRPESTRDAGRVLALCHELLGTFKSQWEPPRASYHAVRGAVERINELPSKVNDRAAPGISRDLAALYLEAAHAAESHARITTRPVQLIHADWHPGNMVFRPARPPGSQVSSGGSAAGLTGSGSPINAGTPSPAEASNTVQGLRVAAVLDFDSARLGVRLLDWANGALQFSMARTGPDPDAWPDEIELARYQSFIRGYHGAVVERLRSGRDVLEQSGDAEAVPWLMIEALIVEAAAPISATGKFGKVDAMPVLRAVLRTASWIRSSAARLGAIARQASSPS